MLRCTGSDLWSWTHDQNQFEREPSNGHRLGNADRVDVVLTYIVGGSACRQVSSSWANSSSYRSQARIPGAAVIERIGISIDASWSLENPLVLGI